MNKKLIIIGLYCFLITACNTVSRLHKSGNIADIKSELNTRIKNIGQVNYYVDRIDIIIRDGGQKSLKAKVYIETGRLIFVSVSYMGFELGRLMFTPDSIKYINRIEREYYFGNYNQLGLFKEIGLSYEEIENFIVKGFPFRHPVNIRKISESITESDSSYIYSYYSGLKKSIKIYFDKGSGLEKRVEISDHMDNLYMVAVVENYLKDFNYPEIIHVKYLKGKDFKQMDITIHSPEIKKYKKLNFDISKHYTEISE